MGKRFQALEKIAPKLNQLPEDPAARVFYEMMSGGLVWSDELPPWEQLDPGESHCLRPVWKFRSSLIMGSPEEKFRPIWEKAQQLFPNWPGFNPARQDQKWRLYFTESQEKALRNWEEVDKKFRDRQEVEEQPQKLPVI